MNSNSYNISNPLSYKFNLHSYTTKQLIELFLPFKPSTSPSTCSNPPAMTMSAAQARDKATTALSFAKDLASDLCSLVLTTLQLLFVAIALLVGIALANLVVLKPLERLKSFVLFLEETIVAFGDNSYEAVKRFDAALHDETVEALKDKLKRGIKVAVHDAPYVSCYLLVAARCLDFGGVRLFLFLAALTCCASGLSTETSVRAWLTDTGVTAWLKDAGDGMKDWLEDAGEVRGEDASAAGRFISFLLFLDANIQVFQERAYEASKRVWVAAVHDAPNLSICLLSAVLCRLSGRGLPYFMLLTVVWCCMMGHLRGVERKSTEDTSTDDGDGDDDGDDGDVRDEASSEGGWMGGDDDDTDGDNDEEDDDDGNYDGSDKESSEGGLIDDGDDDDTDGDNDDEDDSADYGSGKENSEGGWIDEEDDDDDDTDGDNDDEEEDGIDDESSEGDDTDGGDEEEEEDDDGSDGEKCEGGCIHADDNDTDVDDYDEEAAANIENGSTLVRDINTVRSEEEWLVV